MYVYLYVSVYVYLCDVCVLIHIYDTLSLSNWDGDEENALARVENLMDICHNLACTYLKTNSR